MRIRKYITRSGEIKVYVYKQNGGPSNAQLKRECLVKFIESHKNKLDEFKMKSDKIRYIMENIGKYKYSYSTIYNYV